MFGTFSLKNPFVIAAILIVVVVAGYFLFDAVMPSKHSSMPVSAHQAVVGPEEAVMEEAMRVAEGFQDVGSPAESVVAGSAPAEPEQFSAPGPVPTGESSMNQLPSECYPKDVLNSADLLPRDANSLWAQVAPNGQGALSDQNFLTAGYHIGINTVGQTLRNANRQLRSEPPNPQVKVSPWNQTTIEPDINRRPLEIGGTV